jgi:hypothetical protein
MFGAMKPIRLATHASAAFMVSAWVFISGLLLVHFTMGLFAKTAAARVILFTFVLAWLLIPVQVVRYYRIKR